jgi:uncharacterized membrane protein YidH (DUF202 family)
MAWIRTALSLIGFGFGIGRLADYMNASGIHRATPPTLSWSLGRVSSFVGIFGLLAAAVQYARILNGSPGRFRL